MNFSANDPNRAKVMEHMAYLLKKEQENLENIDIAIHAEEMKSTFQSLQPYIIGTVIGITIVSIFIGFIRLRGKRTNSSTRTATNDEIELAPLTPNNTTNIVFQESMRQQPDIDTKFSKFCFT